MNLLLRHRRSVRLDIDFRLESLGDTTKVTVSPDYRVKYGPIGLVMDRLMVRRMYEKGMASLLHGLKEHVEAEVAAA